jgi:hypothetical protein
VVRRGLVILATLSAVALMSSGAGASTQTSRTVDVSTHAKAVLYLVSLGVDPSGVVIQRGAHNYAGPSCPGKGWTCTTANRVLQIATRPPGNTFVCSPQTSSTGPGDCVISQVASGGGGNTATCTESSDASNASQSCQISQSSVSRANTVTIAQSVDTSSDSTQTPVQYSGVLQSSTSAGSNTVTIGQSITALVNQVDSSGSQRQDAHQGVYLEQHTTGAGANNATINQSENLKAAAQQKPSLTQNQNTDGSVNTNASVSQTSGSGTNGATVNQSNVYVGNIQQAALGFQQQGSPGAGEAEFFTQSSTGPSTIAGTQTESQTQRADRIGSLTGQIQYGPMWSDPNQGSNTGDTYRINQTSTQNASNPSLQQDDEYAVCHTSGPHCDVHQSITQNGVTSSNSCTTSDCDISNGLTNGDPSTCSGECLAEAPDPPACPSQFQNTPGFCGFLPATTTTLTAAPNPPGGVACGTMVTFTATVAPSDATGTVTFHYPSGVVIATVPLSGGTASTTTSVITSGTYTADYSGDSTHAGSEGTVSLTVGGCIQ